MWFREASVTGPFLASPHSAGVSPIWASGRMDSQTPLQLVKYMDKDILYKSTTLSQSFHEAPRRMSPWCAQRRKGNRMEKVGILPSGGNPVYHTPATFRSDYTDTFFDYRDSLILWNFKFLENIAVSV